MLMARYLNHLVFFKFRGAPEGHVSCRIEQAILWVNKMYKEKLPYHKAAYKAQQSMIDIETAEVLGLSPSEVDYIAKKRYTLPNEHKQRLKKMLMNRAARRFNVNADALFTIAHPEATEKRNGSKKL